MQRAIWLAMAVLGCHSQARGAEAASSTLRVTHAVAWGLPEAAAATVGFRLENLGERPDTLIGADSPVGLVTLHDVVARRMVEVPNVPIAARGQLILGAGRAHLMLARVDDGVWSRAAIPLALHFTHGGTLAITVPILRVTQALEELEGK